MILTRRQPSVFIAFALFGSVVVAAGSIAIACVGDDPDAVRKPPGATDGGSAEDTSTASDDAAAGPPKLVFVTSEAYPANLGGLVGADAKCNERAAAAGLSGKFTAWLSAGDTNAIARLSSWRGGYKRVDEKLVASSREELLSGNLREPIELDEKKSSVSGTNLLRVWTNTSTKGLIERTGYDCAAFTEIEPKIADGGGLGIQQSPGGYANTKDARWTVSENDANACKETARLYCFED